MFLLQGQLDFNTDGLLLLTNNGDYARYLEHPENNIPRRYNVQCYGKWDESRIKALSHSNIVNGKRYKGCLIKHNDEKSSISSLQHWCTIQVTEGKVNIMIDFDRIVS